MKTKTETQQNPLTELETIYNRINTLLLEDTEAEKDRAFALSLLRAEQHHQRKLKEFSTLIEIALINNALEEE